MGCSPVVRTTTQHSTQHTASTTRVTTTSVNTTPEWWMAFLDWAVGCSMVSWRNFGDVAVWIIRHGNKIFWYLKIRERERERERGGEGSCIFVIYIVLWREQSHGIYGEMFFFFPFSANLYNRYTEEGKIIGTEDRGNRAYGEIVADITSSFMVLLAIYFPSVTGK